MLNRFFSRSKFSVKPTRLAPPSQLTKLRLEHLEVREVPAVLVGIGNVPTLLTNAQAAPITGVHVSTTAPGFLLNAQDLVVNGTLATTTIRIHLVSASGRVWDSGDIKIPRGTTPAQLANILAASMVEDGWVATADNGMLRVSGYQKPGQPLDPLVSAGVTSDAKPELLAKALGGVYTVLAYDPKTGTWGEIK